MKSLPRIAFGILILAVACIPGRTFAATSQHLHFSNNWSGYAATTDRYSGVSGAWTVSSSTATDPSLSADATWVGIGGVSSNDLIQAGTQAIVHNGVTQYSVWYELLPGSQQTAPLAIRPGDRVSVSIQEVGTNRWTITIVNSTTNSSFQTTLTYASSRSSAEWITERPLAITDSATGYLPLSDFKTVTFTRATATNTNKVLMTAQSSGAEQLIMGDLNARLYAVPQNLQNDSFSIAYLSSSASSQYLASLRNAYTFTTPSSSSAYTPAAPREYQQVDTRLIIHIVFATTRPHHATRILH